MAELFERLRAALSDRYRIERELGSGGMATVYFATDLEHDGPCCPRHVHRLTRVKTIRPIGGIGVVALAMCMVSAAASAQLIGNPVYAINSEPGITMHLDFAGRFHDQSEGGANYGSKTRYFGGRVSLGLTFGAFWISGGSCNHRPEAHYSELALAGGAAFNLMKVPALPVAVSLQIGAGVGCVDGDCRKEEWAVGPALMINVPSPGVGIELWVMPRIYVSRTELGFYEDVEEMGLGGSGGLNVNLGMGLGVHAAIDFAHFSEQELSPRLGAEARTWPARSPITAGVGLHYRIRLTRTPSSGA